MTEYAVVYNADAEPEIHVATCGDLSRYSANYYFDAATSQDAVIEAADSFAQDLDLFDGRYETLEEARELSVKCVTVKPCMTKGDPK